MNSTATHAWLILRNDLRLLWREMLTGKMRLFSSVGFLVLLLVFLQLIAILIFVVGRQQPPLVAETFGWFFFGFIMLGATMNHAIRVLFEQADFDLLLPSPISPRAILFARWAAMTVGAAMTVAIFAIPLLNGIAIGLSARYLWGYLVWLLVASSVTSLGVWIILLLVRWMGAQRARTWSQVIAGLLGASLYLLFQGQHLLPREMRDDVARRVSAVFEHEAFSFIARAGRGEWLALVILFAIAGAFAFVTNRLLARLFVTGIQEAGGIKQPGRRDIRHVWVEGLARATFWKDVRLVLRDPLLLSKILPSALFLLPIAFLFKGTAKVDVPGILGPFAVLSTIMISEQLALIATAGEEGWDLIRMSGASTVRLRIAKIAASMAVPMGLCVIMAFVMSVLGRPGLALLTTAIATVSASAMCWLEVANIRPTPRRDLLQTRRSHRAFSGVRIIAGAPLFFGGGGAVALAASGRWAFAAFATGLVMLVALACFTLVKPRHPEFEPATV